MVPQLRDERLRSCALYADAWTNDGRLTLANIRAAADRGATVLNYAEVVDLGSGGAEVVVDGRTIAVSARTVVNAAGPWVDRVRRLEDPAARASMRLSKGVHVVVDGGEDWNAALTIPHDKVRVASPSLGRGCCCSAPPTPSTTASPRRRSVTDDDVQQVFDEAALALRRPWPSARGLLRPASPTRRRRSNGERETRDGVLDRAVRDGERRGRQAHDLPADCARRAPRARRAGAFESGRARCPAPRASTGSRGSTISTRRLARTCSTSTARSRPRCWCLPGTIRLCSSRSFPGGRISARRSSTHARANGLAPTRTCFGGARRLGWPASAESAI